MPSSTTHHQHNIHWHIFPSADDDRVTLECLAAFQVVSSGENALLLSQLHSLPFQSTKEEEEEKKKTSSPLLRAGDLAHYLVSYKMLSEPTRAAQTELCVPLRHREAKALAAAQQPHLQMGP